MKYCTDRHLCDDPGYRLDCHSNGDVRHCSVGSPLSCWWHGKKESVLWKDVYAIFTFLF